MGYPKYTEDNREKVSERFLANSQRQEKQAQREEYIPYHIRYNLPEPKPARRKRRYYL